MSAGLESLVPTMCREILQRSMLHRLNVVTRGRHPGHLPYVGSLQQLHVANTPLDVHCLELVEASQDARASHTTQNVGPYRQTTGTVKIHTTC